MDQDIISSLYWGGMIVPLGSVTASPGLGYATIVFPAYIALANLVEVALIYRRQKTEKEPRV